MQYTVADMVGMRVASQPNQLAATVLDGTDREWTFGEMWCRVHDLARTAARAPVGPNGHVVATLLPNSMDGLASFLACQVARAVIVPVNIRLSDPELVHVLNDSGATMILAEGPLVDVARRVAPTLNRAVDVVDVADIPLGSTWPEVTADPTVGELPSGVFYTSGTTGLPKGSIMTNDTWLLNAMRWGWQLRIGSDDVMLTPGPFFHMSYCTFALCCWMIGGSVRIMPTFDAVQAYEEFADRSTTAFLVPAMTTMIAEEWEKRGRAPMRAMKRMMTAGAAVSAELVELSFDMFPEAQVSETYGWTEGGFATFEIKTRKNARESSVGHPTVGCEIKVVDDAGRPVPQGERGEIYLRTLACGSGYVNLPEASAAVWEGDFLKSGDIGTLDDRGKLRLVDRKHGMIITGGENVYAAEVEQALMRHPDLLEVAVIGRPDDKWGEVVVAIVVPRAGASLDDAGVRSFARTQLADYKVPRRVLMWEEGLPRNSMGKLQKFRVETAIAEAENAAAGG